VLALDLSIDALKGIALKNGWGERVYLYAGDITSEASVANVVGLGLEYFGRIDALICNACVSVSPSWEHKSEQEFDWATSVNLKGTFHGIKHCLRYLRDSGHTDRL